jgi:hypothetical protein
MKEAGSVGRSHKATRAKEELARLAVEARFVW